MYERDANKQNQTIPFTKHVGMIFRLAPVGRILQNAVHQL
jgi:hypothetical protein